MSAQTLGRSFNHAAEQVHGKVTRIRRWVAPDGETDANENLLILRATRGFPPRARGSPAWCMSAPGVSVRMRTISSPRPVVSEARESRVLEQVSGGTATLAARSLRRKPVPPAVFLAAELAPNEAHPLAGLEP